MKISLVAQPYSESPSLYRLLQRAADNPDVFQVDVVVAWARRSGLGALSGSFASMRQRSVAIRMIVGIDAGGASRQGLVLTYELATEAYVVHTPGSRTFHPKLYVIRAARTVQVLVGSQNLTRGGALENFELGVLIELNPKLTEDREFLIEIDAYIGGLIGDGDICKPLNSEFLDYLLSDSSGIFISDEDDAGSSSSPNAALVRGENTLFGRSRRSLSSMRVSRDGVPVPTNTVTDRRPWLSDPGVEAGGVAHRWYKKVKSADAQRLPGSHPSGHMTLTQNHHPIEADSYFRQVLFDVAEWRNDQSRQYAFVSFDVEILGRHIENHQLRIDYNPAFEAGQGNRTSTLRWGDTLGQLLRREVDITGCFASIEKTREGQFRLKISRNSPEPFI